MMISKVFKFVFFLLIGSRAYGQYTLSGTVVSSDKNQPVSGCFIQLGDGDTELTDSLGHFSFKNLKPGTYHLHTQLAEFRAYRKTVQLNKDTELQISLHPRKEQLNEVVITDKTNDFSRTRMRSIENMGIYEGKKTEVIVMDQLVANLATNNARQVYARIPGLNIWENEGAGLQLSIGGRGLDPNRTSNFNVRQNGYDISADALGYPESYYTPPTEAVSRIQVVRGAASLQYGTQFGGLLNFVMKKPVEDKKLELIARQSIGSFGFYNAFTSVSGTLKNFSYYTCFQYKKGDGWRPNSHFDNYNVFTNVNYKLGEKTTLGADFTFMNYLAQQPGGLTDAMFKADPRQSNRKRNWFQVNWNLFALHFNHKFTESKEFNIRFFGLVANRYSLGFRPNRVATIDDNSERDLIKGQFNNIGIEARYLYRYTILKKSSVLLVGSRYYNGFNHSQQGLGSTGSDANFTFVEPEKFITYDYRFPNQNVALFAENIVYLNEKLSITPGIRSEFIGTRAKGYYGSVAKDLAGNIISISRFDENRNSLRHFFLAGIGMSYKPLEKIEIYTNVSQNYRSITFNDMRVNNPSSEIDNNLKDEKGYSVDLGFRSNRTSVLNYDVSLFYLNYNNRIGEIQSSDASFKVIRRRTNIGRAVITGVEAYGEFDAIRAFNKDGDKFSGVVFGNIAVINSAYKDSKASGVNGNQVEFVPTLNLKTGVRFSWNKFKISFQFTQLTDQYTDATNAVDGDVSAVVGLIPAYHILDASMSYEWKRFKLEGTVNNFTNEFYYTRRATGYPGPGILPSDGRSFYLTLQVKL